jgi:pimeloyl-ACP methyl ester carboxylesterase
MRRAIVVAVASALLLAGCTPVVSTPTGEDVAADLSPFYEQVLNWSDCGEGMQCATAEAPLDWDNPATDSIDLALTRQVATGGDRLGSLLVNPGGPGASGYDIVHDSVDFATSETLQASYDIVGFDPRGVGRSTAISCYDDPTTLDGFLYDISAGEPGSDAWVAEQEDLGVAFASECAKYTGDLLGFVDTVSAARDLDLLRAVLGDKKLNYLGYSYGTILGATYAELYPQNTGRLVLDGALDPESTSYTVTKVQAEGFESSLRAFIDACADESDCPFTASTDDSMRMIRQLLDRLDKSPLRATDGRELGSGAMTTAIILPLYNVDSWPYLRQLFTAVSQGDADFAFVLADAYNSRNEDGTYADNSLESRVAINCLDYGSEGDLATWREQAAELAEIAPVFGPQFAYGETLCENWPYPAKREYGAIHASGSSEILVVGTTNDPATPYVWSQALAEQLDNGHLVTREGEGHTGYNKGNECVDSTVDDYFVKGNVPETDPEC